MKGQKTGGRSRGTPNRVTAVRQAEVAASGATPLDIMLKNMRAADRQADQLEALLAAPELEPEGRMAILGELSRQRNIAQKCAADAANYIHPKLANIQHGNDPNNPLNSVTDADRAAVVLAYIAENPGILKQIK